TSFIALADPRRLGGILGNGGNRPLPGPALDTLLRGRASAALHGPDDPGNGSGAVSLPLREIALSSLYFKAGLIRFIGRLGGGVTMFKGFRDFILRVNVVDLAVAVIIGAAFTG